MADHTFSHTAVAPVGIDVAWDALQQPATWESIGGVEHIDQVQRADDGALLGYRFSTTIGGMQYRGEAVTRTAEPPEVMTVDITSEHLEGRIQVVLAPADGGTTVTVHLTARPRGLMSTLAFPAISSAIGRGLPGNVESFVSRLG